MLKYFRLGFGPETLCFHVSVSDTGHIQPQSVLCWNVLSPHPREHTTPELLNSHLAMNEIAAAEFKAEIQSWADTTLVCDAAREETVVATLDCVVDRNGDSRLTKAIQRYKERLATGSSMKDSLHV